MSKRKMKTLTWENDPPMEFKKVGDKIEGTLVARRRVESKKFKSGAAIFYTIADEAGQPHSVLGCAYVDAMLSRVMDGTWIALTYLGKKQLPEEQGGNIANDFLVEVEDTSAASSKPSAAKA